jgi:hypothetical protein
LAVEENGMARKNRRYGYITLRNRRSKIARTRNRYDTVRGGERSRKLRVNVFVTRGRSPTDYTSGEGYVAWACVSKHRDSGLRTSNTSWLAEKRGRGCGPEAIARTPTAVMKKALIALGKKKDLR